MLNLSIFALSRFCAWAGFHVQQKLISIFDVIWAQIGQLLVFVVLILLVGIIVTIALRIKPWKRGRPKRRIIEISSPILISIVFGWLLPGASGWWGSSTQPRTTEWWKYAKKAAPWLFLASVEGGTEAISYLAKKDESTTPVPAYPQNEFLDSNITLGEAVLLVGLAATGVALYYIRGKLKCFRPNRRTGRNLEAGQ